VGVLSDIVVADESQAEAILSMSVPSQELPGADVKGIDTIKLATLESILTGQPYEQVESHDPVAGDSDGGPWVFAVRPSLVSALATASDTQLSAAATEWSATEEFQLDAWPLDAVRSVLAELTRVSKLATNERKRVFLWMSL
jgi:hypothetical protein